MNESENRVINTKKSKIAEAKKRPLWRNNLLNFRQGKQLNFKVSLQTRPTSAKKDFSLFFFAGREILHDRLPPVSKKKIAANQPTILQRIAGILKLKHKSAENSNCILYQKYSTCPPKIYFSRAKSTYHNYNGA